MLHWNSCTEIARLVKPYHIDRRVLSCQQNYFISTRGKSYIGRRHHFKSRAPCPLPVAKPPAVGRAKIHFFPFQLPGLPPRHEELFSFPLGKPLLGTEEEEA